MLLSLDGFHFDESSYDEAAVLLSSAELSRGYGGCIAVGRVGLSLRVLGSIPAPSKLFSRQHAILKFVRCQRTQNGAKINRITQAWLL